MHGTLPLNGEKGNNPAPHSGQCVVFEIIKACNLNHDWNKTSQYLFYTKFKDFSHMVG